MLGEDGSPAGDSISGTCIGVLVAILYRMFRSWEMMDLLLEIVSVALALVFLWLFL